MSYDLYLVPQPPFGLDEFRAYFRGRRHISMSDDGRQAFYENEATGTYFSFDYLDEEDPHEGEADGPTGNTIAFNMNYFRPHVFAFEAADEVEAVVGELHCQFFDPQMDGMEGDWSREGFIRGWDQGNEFGYGLIAAGEPDAPPREPRDEARDMLGQNGCLVAPGSTIETVWRWNRSKDALQAELGERVFVPTIMWARRVDGDVLQDDAITLVTWPESVPIIIPDAASHAIVIRRSSKIAGLKGLLKRFAFQEERHYLVAIEDISDCARGAVPKAGVAARVIPHGPEEMPKALQNRLADDWPENQAQSRITVHPAGSVRNREIVERVLSRAESPPSKDDQ